MKKCTIRLPENLGFNDNEFFDFCQENRDLRLERNANGEIVIMPLRGGNAGIMSSTLNSKISLWNEERRLGEVFSSTGFYLPNGAMRSPDAAWVEQSRWDALSYEQQEKFPPLCPDFVVELISPSDTLKASKEKMDEWIENGCRLGWLILPKEEKVWVYEGGEIKEINGFDQSISGGTVLPGFTFDLAWLK